MKNIIAGVDIGGTHITVCLIDIDNGKLISESYSRGHIDTSLDRGAIITSWTDIIKEAHEKTGRKIGKVGIAMPGPFDYLNGISYIKGLFKYESLYGLNVKQLLADELNIDAGNIKLVNDASAYLLGEMKAGAAKGYDNLVGITLGTGLGSAVYYNDTLEEGDLFRTGFADGTCEDYVSARWLINEYEKISGRRVAGVKDIAERCLHEAEAKMVFEKFGDNLFKVLHKRYVHQSPEIVVIGGNIAKAWDHFVPRVENAMHSEGFLFQLKQAVLGEEAALIGAAYLWNN